MGGGIMIEDDIAKKERWLANLDKKQPINEVKGKSPDFVDKSGRRRGGSKNPNKPKLGLNKNHQHTDPIEWHAPAKSPAPPGKQFCKPGLLYLAVCRVPYCDHALKCRVIDKIATIKPSSYALSGR